MRNVFLLLIFCFGLTYRWDLLGRKGVCLVDLYFICPTFTESDRTGVFHEFFVRDLPCRAGLKRIGRDPLKNLPRLKNLAVLKDLPFGGPRLETLLQLLGIVH